jgi:hypothetical protein
MQNKVSSNRWGERDLQRQTPSPQLTTVVDHFMFAPEGEKPRPAALSYATPTTADVRSGSLALPFATNVEQEKT